MEAKEIALILLDGKFIAFDKGHKLTLNNTEVTDDCKFELTKPDDLFAIKHKVNDQWLGADATSYSFDICKQLYLKNERYAYESWIVEHPAPPHNQYIAAYVLFERPEGINFSCKLRVVEL